MRKKCGLESERGRGRLIYMCALNGTKTARFALVPVFSAVDSRKTSLQKKIWQINVPCSNWVYPTSHPRQLLLTGMYCLSQVFDTIASDLGGILHGNMVGVIFAL